MKNEATNGASSDEDDIFLQGGVPVPISMYSTNLSKPDEIISSGDDDDDDDDDVIEITSKNRSRGRPSKRGRGIPQGGASRASTANSQLPKKKKQKSSVFDLSSDEDGSGDNNIDDDDDEVVEVTPVNASYPVNQQDLNVAASLAKARAVLNNLANEDHIAAEAEMQAKQESERSELIRKQEQQRLEQERQRIQAEKAKAKAAAAVKPIQLKVRSGGHVVKMRIRFTDPLLKMLTPFCKKFGLDPDKAVMQFDGEDVEEKDTPQTHELEDDMIIDVVVRTQ